MDFVDRKKEIARLKRALDSEKKRFIVIYGRRRLGKSTLIKKVLKEKDVYFEADLNEPTMERQLLVNTIRMTYPSFAEARYESWESLLRHFNMVCLDNATLCLDEFPYLVKKNPELPSVLQRLIDSDEMNFNLIICGSSQRMMEKIVLGASEPLYGRADEKICLRPIPLPFWKEAFSLDARATFEEFSIWGGVPRYWTLREEFDSMWSAVEYLILDEHGVLADEPNALFLDESSEIAPYTSIMTALGGGNRRYSSLADAIGKKVSELSQPLKNLREMNYIAKDVPFGEDEEKSRKTLYRFSDPFMSFYYQFVAPNKSYLALGKPERIMQKIVKEFNSHVGALWEHSCARAVSLNRLFGTEWGVASRWWGVVPEKNDKERVCGHVDIELDVVAESIDKRKLLVGECKWNAADYAGRILHRLKAKVMKVSLFADRKVEYVLFLRERPLDIDTLTDKNVHILYPDDVLSLLG
ncbi:MAG: ATP-binding protein [Muribaculaceae bacterium]|nr:ATP-binding protein [Muribaculaceae bacterium]